MGYMADVLISANSSFTNVFERIHTVGTYLYVLTVGLSMCFVALKKLHAYSNCCLRVLSLFHLCRHLSMHLNSGRRIWM